MVIFSGSQGQNPAWKSLVRDGPLGTTPARLRLIRGALAAVSRIRSMTFEHVRRLIERSDRREPCFRALRAVVSSGRCTHLGPGRSSAGEALSVFLNHLESSRAAGADDHGLEQVVAALEALAQEIPILLFHWSTADRVFTLLVQEQTSDLVGCICLAAR
jgi:hypothetical protein